MADYINSQELEWKHSTLAFLSLTIRTLRGFKYKKETESEHLFGAGDEALGIQTGNKKVTGSVKMLKSDYDKLNEAAQAAGYDDFADVPYQLIVLTFVYKKAFGRAQKTDIIRGVKFTEWEKGMEQGAKMMEIDMPFIAVGVKQS